MDEPDPVLAEIEKLRDEISQRIERINELRKQRSHPLVVPVLHYWQYLHQREESYDQDYDDGELLKHASRYLMFMAEDGVASPIGVSVGGYMFTMDKLEEMFGSD